MNQCPKCKKWTLDFDDYFGRYRCSAADCGWMPTSAAERAIKLLESHQEPEVLAHRGVPELGLAVAVTYDPVNDALTFDFGSRETTFDLPEPDGRIIWKVTRSTMSVVGFEILEAKNLGVSQVQVNIAARKEGIERNLKTVSRGFSSLGRPTRMLITKVAISMETESPPDATEFFKDTVKDFESQYCGHST